MMNMRTFKALNGLSLELKTSLGTALVMADPHIGFEVGRGIRIRTGFEERLADFVIERDPDVLILLGDVKDPIGLNSTVRRMLETFFSRLRDFQVMVIKGNHDGRIEEVAERYGVRVVDHALIDGMLFVHGHRKLPRVEFSEAYLGHVHPVYNIVQGGISRSVKVFVRVGRFLILPTVNPYLDGFSVDVGLRMVPFLRDVKVVSLFLPEGVHVGSVVVDRT